MQSSSQTPAAIAHISGTPGTSISGMVSFFPQELGTLVTAQIHGLPDDGLPCSHPIFGFHIPYHAGDLPPLFGCRGDAYLAVLTDRFSVSDIIGRTVVIHRDPDDFSSQPSGHAGGRIGCGVIRPF